MSCDTCRFSQTQPDSPFLQCRRRPPLIVGLGEKVEQAWPVVSGDDWCGEEQPNMSVLRAVQAME